MKSAEEVSRAGPSELGGEQTVVCSEGARPEHVQPWSPGLKFGLYSRSSRIWLVGFKYGCDTICFMTLKKSKQKNNKPFWCDAVLGR